MIKADPDRPAGPITGIPEEVRPIRPSAAWYDLDRYSVYRDLLLLVGFILLVTGLGEYSVPAAVMLAGVGLMLAAYLMSR